MSRFATQSHENSIEITRACEKAHSSNNSMGKIVQLIKRTLPSTKETTTTVIFMYIRISIRAKIV